VKLGKWDTLLSSHCALVYRQIYIVGVILAWTMDMDYAHHLKAIENFAIMKQYLLFPFTGSAAMFHNFSPG
jgi:hypothetical protein